MIKKSACQYIWQVDLFVLSYRLKICTQNPQCRLPFCFSFGTQFIKQLLLLQEGCRDTSGILVLFVLCFCLEFISLFCCRGGVFFLGGVFSRLSCLLKVIVEGG